MARSISIASRVAFVHGIAFAFRYDSRCRDVTIEPDEKSIADAFADPQFTPEPAWQAIAEWSHAFCLRRPDWSVNGRRPEDMTTLPGHMEEFDGEAKEISDDETG